MGYDFQAFPPHFPVQLSVVLSCGLANPGSASYLFSLAKVQISSASTDDWGPPKPHKSSSLSLGTWTWVYVLTPPPSSPPPKAAHRHPAKMVRGTLPPPSGH